jgi:hypothetical protein
VLALRDLIERNQEIVESKKRELLKHLADFEAALEKKRLNLLAVTAFTLAVLGAPGSIGSSVELVNKLVTNILRTVGEAKIYDDATRKLPSAAAPLAITGPDRRAVRAPTWMRPFRSKYAFLGEPLARAHDCGTQFTTDRNHTATGTLQSKKVASKLATQKAKACQRLDRYASPSRTYTCAGTIYFRIAPALAAGSLPRRVFGLVVHDIFTRGLNRVVNDRNRSAVDRLSKVYPDQSGVNAAAGTYFQSPTAITSIEVAAPYQKCRR